MKHFITVFLLLFTCLSTYAAVTIKTSVSFGAKSKGCKGLGICKAQTETNSGMIQATLTYNMPQPDKITLEFREGELSKLPAEMVNGIRAGRFVQEEAWELPTDIISALSLKESYTVPKGTYTATISNGNVVLNLTMARSVAVR